VPEDSPFQVENFIRIRLYLLFWLPVCCVIFGHVWHTSAIDVDQNSTVAKFWEIPTELDKDFYNKVPEFLPSGILGILYD
jgi:hypothetical protein